MGAVEDDEGGMCIEMCIECALQLINRIDGDYVHHPVLEKPTTTAPTTSECAVNSSKKKREKKKTPTRSFTRARFLPSLG